MNRVIALLTLLALPWQAPAQSALDYAVLIVSRERLELATACDVGLYLDDQLAARLVQGQLFSFNLPPGPLSIRLGLLGPGPCRPGIEQLRQQAITLRAGEVRKFRLAQSTEGLYLIPTNAFQ
ncbi:hypothetical protein [Metapseudomonas resinovorans]|uniref:Uncharacterized protein n=1 Tax=Metapseudomonas resinovorans NBRC 106553 TaxID=1245471 RepID=S6ANY4_METRE|nr:hypothetical protein [Pseudomonas resinovorans]BAN50775.1 hypothetical protein PCA10_50430 [Pseudomonas resinovorans NBRC 106553]